MNERDIFHAALEITDPVERAAYLDKACAGDVSIKAHFENLLELQPQLGSFLESTALGGMQASEPVLAADRVFAGRFKLRQKLGEGGMGEVWVADQLEPVRRRVALKVVRSGLDSTLMLARFDQERQALALMDHPSIAKVLDAGMDETGHPYFAMELIKGVPITKYCDEAKLSPQKRIELFVSVCHAVQHAHQKGIIHRDLKPSNILVGLDGDEAVPKVIDFGVAKSFGPRLTEHSVYTEVGALIGTVEYMSPEQAELNNLDIDTRTDIYALGAVLYELLTGSVPFSRKDLPAATFLEMLRIVREADPPKPSTKLSSSETLPGVAADRQTEPRKLIALVRGELDWIVMKALEKDRNRRYETANGFAMDVQRYLRDEPVLACPPAAWYRLRKLTQRNKGRLALAALVLFFLTSLGGVAGWAALQHAAQRATLNTDIGRDLDAARDFCRQDRLREASAVLDHAQALTARGGAVDDLGERVAELRKDVDMGARLEEIRLESAAVKDGAFDHPGAVLRYAEAFRAFGLDLNRLEPDKAAARIEGSAIREQLVAALDDWLSVSGDNRARVLAVLALADADPWRRQLRVLSMNRDPKPLRELARETNAPKQPPADAVLLGKELRNGGDLRLAVDFLRQAQQEHPNDFWLNQEMGFSLMRFKPPRAAEAMGYYRAAVALRPSSPGALLNLANAMIHQRDLPSARAALEKAIALKPEYAEAHCHLGLALYQLGDLPAARVACEEAIALKPDYVHGHNQLGIVLLRQRDLPGARAEFRKAIALKLDYARAYGNLGLALSQQGDLTGALAAYRQAIALEPDYATYYLLLGNALLHDQGDLPGACAAYQKAIALTPDYADAHCQLGLALQQKGEFAKALEELRRGHELGSKQPQWRLPSAQWLRHCQRLLELDACLSDILAGKVAPANASERIELAELCICKQRNRAAVCFYEDAFAAQPTLLAAQRYNAACAAALAGCGRGNDAGKLEDQERARLRRQALDWLCAELEVKVCLLDKGPSPDAPDLAQGLQHWLVDPDFVGVREPNHLDKLAPEEQDEWGCLWDEVAEQAARARKAAQPIPPTAPIRIGQPLDLAGPTVAGDKLDLKQLHGKVVLINFWASWSSLSVAEAPNIKRVYDRYHKDGLEVIGVSLDHTKEALDTFIQANEVPWPQLFFEDQEAQGWNNPLVQKHGVRAIPLTILVDQKGNVARLNLRGQALEEAVSHLLGKGPSPPPDPLVLPLARYYIRLGQWDEAAANYAQSDLLARPLNEDAVAYACLFVIRGDGDGYNRFCQGMIQRAAKTKDPFEAYVLARSCAIARKSPVDPAQVVQWANQAVASDRRPWHFHVLGLAQYRAGQFDQALQSFTEANLNDWKYRELNWFGLALVHHHLGHPDEARQCLAKGIQWLDREGPQGSEQPSKLMPQDWSEAQVLRREAEEMLKIKRSP